MSKMGDLEKGALDLYLTFECTHQDHFTAGLYRLIAKADITNRARLSLSYPIQVSLYGEWMLADPPQVFYDKYHVKEHYVPDNPGESHD